MKIPATVRACPRSGCTASTPESSSKSHTITQNFSTKQFSINQPTSPKMKNHQASSTLKTSSAGGGSCSTSKPTRPIQMLNWWNSDNSWPCSSIRASAPAKTTKTTKAKMRINQDI